MNGYYAMVAAVPVTAGIAALALRRRARPGSFSVIEWSDRDCAAILEYIEASDHERLIESFRTHAEAMQQQVSEYADALAGGDMVLRERLRQFEASR